MRLRRKKASLAKFELPKRQGNLVSIFVTCVAITRTGTGTVVPAPRGLLAYCTTLDSACIKKFGLFVARMPEVSLPPALSPEALETSVHDETGASASLTSHFKGNRTLVLLLRHCL